ncbi:hypothetical protein IL306_014871, partial [Fusarium sp. DS 682]
TPNHVLKQDKVILYSKGRIEVVYISIWEKLLKSKGINPITPEIDYDWLKAPAKAVSPCNLEERASCDATTSYVTDTCQRFVDWDVQMSPVVIGAGRNGIDVSVASDFSVSNSVSISAGLNWKAVKDRLGASFGIDYSRTWTTRATITVCSTVFPSEVSVVVTKP